MKLLFLTILIALLIGGIVGTSIDVFNLKKNTGSIAAIYESAQQNDVKLSMRQIDSLSAAGNFSFTVRNAVDK